MSYTGRVPVTVIGIDFAAQPKGTGLALGRHTRRGLSISQVRMARGAEDLLETLAGWASKGQVLVAADAPLGWPRPLATRLAKHRAGQVLDGEPKQLFRRLTDREIHRRIGKLPLEVGADRIARTAHAALRVLGQVAHTTSRALPVLWDHEVEGAGLIEVYPAATLLAHGISPRGYKAATHDGEVKRLELSQWLASQCLSCEKPEQMAVRDDLLDAALCVLAGHDFLRGRAMGPSQSQQEQAEFEGWIWVASPQ